MDLNKKHNLTLTRRGFLKLALSSSAAIILIPLIDSCTPPPTITPIATSTVKPAILPPTPLKPTATSIMPSPTPLPSTATLDPLSAALDGLEGLPIDTFFDESFKRLMLRDPESLTLNGVSSLYGVADDQLTDVSEIYIRQTQAMQTEILAMLRSYDRTALTSEQIVSDEIYDWQLDDMVRAQPFIYHDYPFTGFVNDAAVNLYLIFTDYQPMNDLPNAQAYLARLSQIGVKFDNLQEGLKQRKTAGIVLPALLVPDVINQLSEITTTNAVSTPFYTTFANKLYKINGLSTTEKKDLTDQAEKTIRKTVQPAYLKMANYFKGIQAKAPENLGLWQFPQGLEYYTYLLRHHTTTELTADQIHELGLQHADRIQAEMLTIFAQLGFSKGDSMPALMNRLNEENKMVSGDSAVAAYETAIAKADGMFDQVLDLRPRGKVIVQGGELGNFLIPMSIDGSKPAVFYAITAYPQPERLIQDIAFHETIPGHHTQTAIARELNLPAMRRVTNFTAYVEGWALYAERLMWELGAFENDPFGNLGRLELELLRAVRLVADTGIHAKKWTYDQTVAYMEKTMGYVSEIKRYTAMPGQATAYYIGFLKILELRQKAQDKLGEKFVLKDFHRIVLGNGEMPLSTLEQLVDKYTVG
jgi:uncharacterized protein (DUF885 family)